MTQKQIAAKRGWQTLIQSLAVVVIMAAISAIGSSLTASSWGEWIGSWQTWTWAAFQAAGTAAVAWAVRRYADNSGIDDTTNAGQTDSYTPEHADRSTTAL